MKCFAMYIVSKYQVIQCIIFILPRVHIISFSVSVCLHGHEGDSDGGRHRGHGTVSGELDEDDQDRYHELHVL